MFKVTDKAFLTSFKAAELIAKGKKTCNIGEKLILPACKEIFEEILGFRAAKKISKVRLSNNTVH
jgi:hypothetical protein